MGLGETNAEIIEVMRDLRRHGVTMLTLGQYLQPSATTCRYSATSARTRLQLDESRSDGRRLYPCRLRGRSFAPPEYADLLQAKGMEVALCLDRGVIFSASGSVLPMRFVTRQKFR